MPIWLYEIRQLYSAMILAVFVETLSLAGLFLARRFLLPHLRYHEGANDAVSGTVQAIGVFYGITVGLIAVGVWNTNSNASELVSKEAVAIASLYRDVSGYPDPLRKELKAKLREYTVFVIEQAWPAQKTGHGQTVGAGIQIIDEFQAKIYTFQPANPGQVAIHGESLRAFNNLLEARRLRIDAVDHGLSTVMWILIWIGAAMSIGVAYLFNVQDPKLHASLIALMAGFLTIVLFMIIINDKPFYGRVSIPPDPYQLILDRLIDVER